MAENEPNDGPGDTPDPSEDTADFKAEAEKWKALARKHEERSKENADAAKRLAELEEQDKTEVQRLTDASQAAQDRADKAERELLRLRVASRKGLTEAQAKRLQGDTEDELEADAEELLASFTPAEGDKPDLSRRPAEKLKPGASPDADPEEPISDIAARIDARHR